MRGDNKWPPEQTRQQMVVEEETEKKIAEGPAARPKKVNKVKKSRLLGKKNIYLQGMK